MKELINNWKFVFLLCFTLGLAPYVPEPHIWGKIKWISGGAREMQYLDWMDVLFHGIPFFLLIRLIVIKAITRLPKR